MNDIEFKHNVLSLSQRIYPMAARILRDEDDARDAIQEVMIKMWKNRKKLRQHPNVAGFIILSTRNYCFDLLKKQKKLQFKRIEDEFLIEANEIEGEKRLNKTLKDVKRIIQKLPENQRDVMILRDLDGFEFDEISIVTGLKAEHIRVLLSRARKNVRKEYIKTHDYEQKCK